MTFRKKRTYVTLLNSRFHIMRDIKSQQLWMGSCPIRWTGKITNVRSINRIGVLCGYWILSKIYEWKLRGSTNANMITESELNCMGIANCESFSEYTRECFQLSSPWLAIIRLVLSFTLYNSLSLFLCHIQTHVRTRVSSSNFFNFNLDFVI